MAEHVVRCGDCGRDLGGVRECRECKERRDDSWLDLEADITAEDWAQIEAESEES